MCEYWYQVLLSIVSSIVLPGTLVVPICCTDIFVCKRMYTIDLNFNHAHHRDTYQYICSTHIFACKRTYQYTIDLNLNHVNHRDRVKMREWLRVPVPVPGTWYATITRSSRTNKQGDVGTGTCR